jgi:hypothetical protein
MLKGCKGKLKRKEVGHCLSSSNQKNAYIILRENLTE